MMNDSLNALLTARTLLATIEKQATEVLSSLEIRVTLNELYVLYFLDQADGLPLRINDLSVKLKLSQSATSRMLTRFENTCGVITRKKDEQDKRSVRISLTAHGQDLLAQAQTKLAPVLAEYTPILKGLEEWSKNAR